MKRNTRNTKRKERGYDVFMYHANIQDFVPGQSMSFALGDSGQGRNLADLIAAKLAAHESKGKGLVQTSPAFQGEPIQPSLPPKVVEVYKKYPEIIVVANIQGWTATVSLQVWKTSESFQNHSFNSKLGGNFDVNESTRLDSPCNVRSNSSIRIESRRKSSSTVFFYSYFANAQGLLISFCWIKCVTI